MLWIIIIKSKTMDNPNFLSSIRSPKSSTDNQSPFQTFQQFVKNQSHSQLFTPLPERSPSNANSLHTHHFPQYTTLQDSQPIQPQQHQRKKQIYFSNKKKAILLASFILMLIFFYQQINVALFMREYGGQVGDELESSYPDNLKNLLWIKRYYQAQMQQSRENMQKQKGVKKLDKTMEEFVRRIKRQMRKHEAKMYDEVGSNTFEQLPICIYIPSSSASTPKTIKSIIQSSYTNKTIIVHKSNYIQQLIQKGLDIIQIESQPSSHDDVRNILIHNCQQSSIILFLNQPILRQSLTKINQIHQKWNIYLTFSERDRVLEVHSFYLRIYQLFCLQLQAKVQQQGQSFAFGDREQLALALLELTARRAKKIKQEEIFTQKTSYAYLLVNPTNPIPLIRTSFTTLTRLSQDFSFSLLHNQEHYNAMRYTPKEKLEQLNLSMQKMNRALQLQDLLYLPHNHYLSSRQLVLYNTAYSTCQYMEKQLRFCIAILSHNNIQNNRYKKVLLSIFMQKYKNYHIVFFDDFSDDGTLEKSMEYARQRGMESKIVFVKNLERKYATYNIVNAGFNFCGEDQIQVLVDGDDELIGSHVLNLLNGLYQKDPNKWLIYTNFKTNLFQFGTSHESTNKEVQKMIWKSGHRTGDHYMGQLRSFRTKLLRLIPKKYHQNEFGYWLDTVYDDALQHCFFEMGAPQHVQYVPEICYEYNREYGANDDSSEQKVFNRQNTYEYLLKLESLSEVEDIEKAQINKQMKQIFEKQLSSNTFKILKEQAK